MNIRIISALPVIDEVGPQTVIADFDDWHIGALYGEDGPIPEEWILRFRKMAEAAFKEEGPCAPAAD